MTKGTLFLIPSPLGNEDVENVIPAGALAIVRWLTAFIVEEVKTARRYLRQAGVKTDFSNIRFFTYNEHSEQTDVRPVIDFLMSGHDVGLLSEAGMPCVADPGGGMVQEAHRNGIRVIPLTGPSSILLALIASGFNGQNFAFNGYLPVNRNERHRALKELERKAYRDNQTQIFIETPYRNHAIFQAIMQACHPETMLCIACDLTLETEFISTLSVDEWKKNPPDINKRPAVFLIYK